MKVLVVLDVAIALLYFSLAFSIALYFLALLLAGVFPLFFLFSCSSALLLLPHYFPLAVGIVLSCGGWCFWGGGVWLCRLSSCNPCVGPGCFFSLSVLCRAYWSL
mgnify:CR=1 FL=1